MYEVGLLPHYKYISENNPWDSSWMVCIKNDRVESSEFVEISLFSLVQTKVIV